MKQSLICFGFFEGIGNLSVFKFLTKLYTHPYLLILLSLNLIFPLH